MEEREQHPAADISGNETLTAETEQRLKRPREENGEEAAETTAADQQRLKRPREEAEEEAAETTAADQQRLKRPREEAEEEAAETTAADQQGMKRPRNEDGEKAAETTAADQQRLKRPREEDEEEAAETTAADEQMRKRCRGQQVTEDSEERAAEQAKPVEDPFQLVFIKNEPKKPAEGSGVEEAEDWEDDEGGCYRVVKTESSTAVSAPHPNHKPLGLSTSTEPKEQRRFVLRPAVLQAPPRNPHMEPTSTYGTSLLKKSSDEPQVSQFLHLDHTENAASLHKSPKHEYGTSGGTKFVFGENIKARMKLDEKPKDGVPLDSQSESTSNLNLDDAANSTNTGTEQVLTAPKPESSNQENKEISAASDPEQSSPEATTENRTRESRPVEESAAAHSKASNQTCSLEKTEVRTGEESELHVFQMQCKLFVFEKTAQEWMERGRGLLRLNDVTSPDDGTPQSRLVMRTHGSLRLVLNTKLWPQMQVDKVSEKSVLLTALDTVDQQVKVFLVSGTSKSTDQLAAHLHQRISALKSTAEVPAAAEVPE